LYRVRQKSYSPRTLLDIGSLESGNRVNIAVLIITASLQEQLEHSRNPDLGQV
jgi:hypothetical protein